MVRRRFNSGLGNWRPNRSAHWPVYGPDRTPGRVDKSCDGFIYLSSSTPPVSSDTRRATFLVRCGFTMQGKHACWGAPVRSNRQQQAAVRDRDVPRQERGMPLGRLSLSPARTNCFDRDQQERVTAAISWRTPAWSHKPGLPCRPPFAVGLKKPVLWPELSR